MKQRVISAMIGIVICIAGFILGSVYPSVLAVVAGIIAVIMVGEFLTAKSLLGEFKISLPSLLFAFIMPIMSNSSYIFLPVYLFTLILFTITIFNHTKISISKLMFAYGGSLLITFGMSSLTYLIYDKFFSIYYLVLALGIPWCSDAGAYFVGCKIGKHKLCPDISPKKTIEGAVGGIISGILGSVIISLIFQFLIYKTPNVSINYGVIIAIGVANSILSILGDLTFSLIKRSCKIKDFGNIMPGHGGLCDRFDSVIFTVPLIMFAANANLLIKFI